jgi:hypothetical protein
LYRPGRSARSWQSFADETGGRLAVDGRRDRTSQWLQVHRYFRETLVLVGLPLLLVGVFGTITLVTDITAIRLLLLVALAYALARLGFALIHA